jgi:ribosomal protein S12 methylthiotransferase
LPESCSVAFLTLGCPKNEVDTDTMRASVAAAGFAVVGDIDDADVVVVNTCAFIREATEESVSTVLAVVSEWVPAAPGRRVVVAGCMPSRYSSELTDAMSEVDAFVPVAEEADIVAVIERVAGVAAHEPGPTAASRSVEGFSAYIKIADGCHRACAYCAIPSIRGPYRSRPLDEIVVEARELVAAGAREVVLIGQDITAYGRDLDDGHVLADIVRRVAAVEGLGWLRLMYLQPDGISDDLLAAMADNARVCHYLDMPLQHASASVLRSMRRRGDGVEYLELIGRIRAALPDAVLRTTLIAGFPGETRADVAEVERFVESARFDYVGVFAYSPEEGTEAASMPGQVSPRTRRARAQRLRDLSDVIGFERAASRVGQVVEVLIEGTDEDEGFTAGRWRGQAPEIDGLVIVDRGAPGDMVLATVVDSVGYDLEVEVG